MKALITGAVLSVMCVSFAWAQSAWRPEKQVEIILPTAPGGGNDAVARLMAKVLQEQRIVTAPILVMNIVLVEVVFSVPGFFRHLRRALGQNVGGDDKVIDIPTIQAISIWAAVLIVLLSLIGDLAIARLDPRIRAGGRPMT